jgi:hypothetical protein
LALYAKASDIVGSLEVEVEAVSRKSDVINLDPNQSRLNPTSTASNLISSSLKSGADKQMTQNLKKHFIVTSSNIT